MTWLCVDKDGSEWAFDGAPERGETGWYITFEATSCVELPKGSIEKLIGKKLTWRSNPVEIKKKNMIKIINNGNF